MLLPSPARVSLPITRMLIAPCGPVDSFSRGGSTKASVKSAVVMFPLRWR